MSSHSSIPQDYAWFCLRTQTKREHIAAQHIREFEDIEVFCPRLRYRKATRRGTIWWVEPMFPGYLLARFKLTEHERIICSRNGVTGIVRFGSFFPTIHDSFIESLKREMAQANTDDDDIISLKTHVEVGDEAEVANGPLQGLSGVIIEILPAEERVRILIDFLGNPQPINVNLFSLLLPRRPTVPITPDTTPLTTSPSKP